MEKIIEKIRNKANQELVADADGFVVDDYAGGNVDDAYQMGVDHGEVYFALELLAHLSE